MATRLPSEIRRIASSGALRNGYGARVIFRRPNDPPRGPFFRAPADIEMNVRIFYFFFKNSLA